MIGEGARLTAQGVYSEYVVEQVMKNVREVPAPRHRHNDAGAMDSSSAKRR